MKREMSSTKWGRAFINEPLIALVREAWLNATSRPQAKLAKHISKTAYPDGTEKHYKI
jgi:hypothetical protein